jgi:hypothetical protein
MTDLDGLPTFVTIGSMKSGTSSLHMYLSAHPDISMSSKKEPDFFLEAKNWAKGIDWYRSLYDASRPHRGESSVNYTKFPNFPDAPEKMASMIPEARLVFVARDPIDRIRSHHSHQVAAMRLPYELHLDRDRKALEHYISCSRYAMQISRFLNFFPKDRLHIVCSHDLREEPAKTVCEVIAFLGADPSRLPDGTCALRYHDSGEKDFPTPLGRIVARWPGGKRLVRSKRIGPLSHFLRTPARRIELSTEVTEFLRDQLAEDAAEFRKMSGRGFPHWSV